MPWQSYYLPHAFACVSCATAAMTGWLGIAMWGLGLLGVGAGGLIAVVLDVKKRWFWSVPVVPPTEEMLCDEPLESCQLFTFLPELKGKVAWRKLGDYPTPVHTSEVPVAGLLRKVTFKREDMSSPRYGGNKVRTLEFQLACCAAAHEARQRELGCKARVYATGAPGSNQIVAAAVHSQGILHTIEPVGLFLMPEAANIETGMNLASSYSLMTYCLPNFTTIGVLSTLKTFYHTLYRESDDFILPSGGANPTGALGHVSAALELAEQVRQGLLDEPTRIFVPLGSGCTTSGLIIGICICRKLGLGFLQLRRLHSVGIHQMMRFFNGFLPRMMVKGLVKATTQVLCNLGGPDVRAEALQFLRDEWVMETQFTGRYGEPTGESLAARELYYAQHRFVSDDDAPIRPPWLCHTFNSKSLACVFDHFSNGTIQEDESVVIWSTKSLVQPLGDHDPLAAVRFGNRDSSTFLSDSGITRTADMYTLEYTQRITT